MVEITIIGSSSGDPSPDRANSSWLMEVGGTMYQFDAGEGFASSALRYNIDHSGIGTIIISHSHPDHITGLFVEIQMMHLARRSNPLSIYLPAEVRDAVEMFMQATYLFPERMGFEIDIRTIVPDPVFLDENIAIYARANSHLDNYKATIEEGGYPNLMQSYSFVIKAGDKRILYSGDIGSLSDYSDLLEGCDLLITEGLHLDLEELFARAGESGLKRMILTHLSSEMYGNPEPVKALAKKHGIEDFHIAEDGLKVRL